MTYNCKDCKHPFCLLTGIDVVAERCEETFVPVKQGRKHYTMFYCGRCGKRVARNHRICIACGAKQDWTKAGG